MKFGDLKIGPTAKKYLLRAIDTNHVTEGPITKEFENRFSELFGYKHSIACGTGTDADICCCAALYGFGAERGDEIIVPATTFVASANSVLAAGFIPKFVDINVETLNIDPQKIEEAITDKTRAIMAVHLMGKPAEMDSILEISKKHNLMVIEDACEAHGAQYEEKYVGSIGDMGAFSFYVAHVVTCGEGGVVTTSNDKINDLVRSIKTHGRPTGSIYFDFQRFGLNLRTTDLNAAIGMEGLEQFHETFKKRKENQYKLLGMLKELEEFMYLIREEKHEVISPHAFPIVLKDPKFNCKKLYDYLESRGIQCKTLFGSLPTQHNAFSFLKYKKGQFPSAEYVGENGLHFGIHQFLTESDLMYMADSIKSYFKTFKH